MRRMRSNISIFAKVQRTHTRILEWNKTLSLAKVDLYILFFSFALLVILGNEKKRIFLGIFLQLLLQP